MPTTNHAAAFQAENEQGSGSALATQPDRRVRKSGIELASQTLAHAVNYLVLEQLEGRRDGLPANREAIALLCEAGRALERTERRGSARESIAGWLRGASLTRAAGRDNQRR